MSDVTYLFWYAGLALRASQAYSWQNIVYQFEYMMDENLMDDNYHRFCNIRLHHSSIHKTAGLEGSKHLLFQEQLL